MYGAMVELLLPEVDKVFYLDTEVQGILGNSFLFSSILALMPIFIVCTWSLCRANKKAEKFSIAIIVVVLTFLAVFIRQQVLAAYLKKLSYAYDMTPDDVKLTNPLSKLDFEPYMFAGLCAGCIINVILYRRRNK